MATRTLKQRISGGTALAKVKLAGASAFVSHRVSWGRSDLCLKCPLHEAKPIYTTLEKAENAVALAHVSHIKHQQSIKLGRCGACKCLLPFLVHTKDELAISGMTEGIANQMPKFCWKLQAYKRLGGTQSPDAAGKQLEAIGGGGCNCG